MKRIITIVFSLFCISATFAQGSDDACLFSQTFYQGTAKALGMGNALGAVGGDMTAICINPAGMGIYRNHELTITAGLLDNFQQSAYYGTSNNANKFRMNLPSLSYVNAKQRSNFRPLRFTQFGIGLTRVNDYNIHTLSKGINPTSSKIDNYLNQIHDKYYPEDYNGPLYTSFLPITQLEESASEDIFSAWKTYLIDIYQDSIGDFYSSPVPQGHLWQGQDSNFKGRSEEWTFAGSFNYFDKLYVGVSANLAHIKRVGERIFRESHPDGADPGSGFNQWSFTESLRSTGWGGNAKVGFIYHAGPWFRFGGAFHSPTIYAFTETWQTETESEILSMTRKYISPESHYEYTFIKPMKWVGSMVFFIGQSGMVSFDAEYTNFGAARFRATDYDYDALNDDIKATYGKTFNFRLGSEWLLGSSYLRLGAAYYGSPLGLGKSDGSVKKASIGISVPITFDVTFDFAYELSHGLTQQCLYDAGTLGIEPVTHKAFRNNLAITIKVRY